MTSNGYIYILLNPSFDKNVLKIGFTKRNPLTRAKELSGHTAIPEEFIVAYTELVKEPEFVENKIHLSLKKKRISNSREFFRLPLQECIDLIRMVTKDHPPSFETKNKKTREVTCKRCGYRWLPLTDNELCPKCW